MRADRPIPDNTERVRRQLHGTVDRYLRPKLPKPGRRPLTMNHVYGAAKLARASGVPDSIVQAEIRRALAGPTPATTPAL